MGITKKKMAAAAMVCAGFGTTLLWLYAEQLDDEHQALVADQVEVVKAAQPIDAGVPMTKDRITTEKVPRRFLPPNPLLESELNIYLGTPVAVNVEEGAMLLTSDFSVTDVALRQPFAPSPLVIKTARLRVEVESPAQVGQTALEAVSAAGGYIVESEIEVERSIERFSMTARVPATKFEAFVNDMSELGTPTARRIRGAGVTGDVLRLERKIGNADFAIEGLRDAARMAKKEERQVDTIEIISGDDDATATRTTTTTRKSGDAAIAADLVRARSDKAELEDELTQLHAESALSTVELVLAKPLPTPERVEVPPPPTFWEEVGEEFTSSSRALMKASFGAVRVFAAALPWLLALSPILVGLVFWRRRQRRELDLG